MKLETTEPSLKLCWIKTCLNIFFINLFIFGIKIYSAYLQAWLFQEKLKK